jgi:hypothetical protein
MVHRYLQNLIEQYGGKFLEVCLAILFLQKLIGKKKGEKFIEISLKYFLAYSFLLTFLI